MRALRPLSGALLALTLAVGCGELPEISQVTDLRILGVQAEPPEQLVSLSGGGGLGNFTFPDGGSLLALLDGGIPPGLLDAGIPPGLLDGGLAGLLDGGFAVATTTVTALIAHPNGVGLPLSWQWSVCGVLDGSTSRCSSDSPSFRELGGGSGLMPDVSTELSTTFTADKALIEAARARDTFRGLGGIEVPVQLSVTLGSETLVGIKRIVFQTEITPGSSLNQNPSLEALTFRGEPWNDGDRPEVKGFDGGVEMGPVIPDGGEQPYARPTLTGGTQDYIEGWRFDFFTTDGTFQRNSTGSQGSRMGGGGGGPGGGGPGGGNQRDGGQDDNRWSPSAGLTSRNVSVWVVVRDGRGGESWARRAFRFLGQ